MTTGNPLTLQPAMDNTDKAINTAIAEWLGYEVTGARKVTTLDTHDPERTPHGIKWELTGNRPSWLAESGSRLIPDFCNGVSAIDWALSMVESHERHFLRAICKDSRVPYPAKCPQMVVPLLCKVSAYQKAKALYSIITNHNVKHSNKY